MKIKLYFENLLVTNSFKLVAGKFIDSILIALVNQRILKF